MRGAQLELLGAFVVLVDRAAGAAGQLAGVGDNRVEHRVDVERRAHRSADVAQGRQLLDGTAQLARPRLQLLEEPNILDGDDGLVGKGLEERDLPLAEGARHGATDGERSDRLAVSKHRH